MSALDSATTLAVEAWLRAGAGDTILVHPQVTMTIPDRLPPPGTAYTESVAIPAPRTIRRQAVRFGTTEDGWTLWVGIDAETSEPLAVTSVRGWNTW